MSKIRAEEFINSAILHLNMLEKRINLDFNVVFCHTKIQDILTALLDAKEELKDYKL